MNYIYKPLFKSKTIRSYNINIKNTKKLLQSLTKYNIKTKFNNKKVLLYFK